MTSNEHSASLLSSNKMRVFLFLATIVILIILLAYIKRPDITQDSLLKEINVMQQKLPMRIDAYTELTNVELETMQIKYTFIVVNNPTQESNTNVKDNNFSQQIETAVKANACVNKNTKRYINSGVSLSYLYLNKDNQLITNFIIPTGFCN